MLHAHSHRRTIVMSYISSFFYFRLIFVMCGGAWDWLKCINHLFKWIYYIILELHTRRVVCKSFLCDIVEFRWQIGCSFDITTLCDGTKLEEIIHAAVARKNCRDSNMQHMSEHWHSSNLGAGEIWNDLKVIRVIICKMHSSYALIKYTWFPATKKETYWEGQFKHHTKCARKSSTWPK